MVGVVVDAVCGVLQIAPINIELPKSTDNKVRNGFIICRVAIGNLAFIFLDVDQGFWRVIFLLSLSVQVVVKKVSRYTPSHVLASRLTPRN